MLYEVITLKYASAAEMVRLLTALTREEGKTNLSSVLAPKVVADERTNAVVVSGEPQGRQRIISLIRQLDQDHRITSYNVCYTKLLRRNRGSGRENRKWLV